MQRMLRISPVGGRGRGGNAALGRQPRVYQREIRVVNYPPTAKNQKKTSRYSTERLMASAVSAAPHKQQACGLGMGGTIRLIRVLYRMPFLPFLSSLSLY